MENYLEVPCSHKTSAALGAVKATLDHAVPARAEPEGFKNAKELTNLLYL